MKTFSFGALSFTVTPDGRVALTKCFANDHTALTAAYSLMPVCEFDVAGGRTTGSNYLRESDETAGLRYVSHTITDGALTLVQRSATAEVTSVFTGYGDTNAIRVTQTIKNISAQEMCLTTANTLSLRFGTDAMTEQRDWYFHKFTNARYVEGMPDVRSLYDMGMYARNYVIHVENVGNASSYENLPQGILENRRGGGFLMFQIESYYDWFYEITIGGNGLFNLQLGGPSALRHAWNKVLAPRECYTTVPAAIAAADTLNGVLAEMTRYRRHIKPACPSDAHLPAIFNEYMHYSWDSPFDARVREMAPYVKKAGCEYYVVDAGWHNPAQFADLLDVYTNFGEWVESRERFPDGIRATAEYVHSLGLKFGLWIAPEVVGLKSCMLEYYDDSCFVMRDGKKIRNVTEYLLDFRNPKVRDYMDRALDRMIDEYGCDYIKFDGCPNPGFGTDVDSTSLGDGLEQQTEAFLAWVAALMARHPQVVFEDCAGGGQRIDYKALSMFQLVSTSDQTSYLLYPYISANILASVLPEQAAVWCYPVDSFLCDYSCAETANRDVSEERVVLNMINGLLGRLHLASRFHLLSEEKQALIREAVDVYDRMVPDKLCAVPYLPAGWARYGDTFAAAGLKTEDKLWLAVWNLRGQRHVTLPLPGITVRNARVAYPAALPTEYSFDSGSLTVDFSEDEQARLFEIALA